jgi:hypothetical protein
MFFNINLQSFSKEIYLEPLWSNSSFHFMKNEILGYFIQDIHSNEFAYINISHNELSKNDILEINELILNNFEKIIVLDKKSLQYFLEKDNVFDLRIVNGTNYEFEEMNLLNVPSKYHFSKSLNQYIPITKHIEYFCQKFEIIKSEIRIEELTQSVFKNSYIKAFSTLEISPITVSKTLLESLYQKQIKTSYIEEKGYYTSYNLYNPSLRPTMSKSSINLLNLPKNNNSRELIISSNGYLFEYDYKGFHLSILCKLLKYELQYKDVYTQLYNEIHKTELQILEKEQHEEIKNEFFQIMFSEILYTEHDSMLLKKVLNFKKYLLEGFEINGFIKSPFIKEIYFHESFTTKNIFSIFFRICETELNVKTLLNIQDFLKGKLSKLILYQFDSFVIDWHKEDGKEILKDLKKIIETEDNYKISISYGNNFNEMKEII